MATQAMTAPADRPYLWILGPRADLLLFIATPVLVLPLAVLASSGDAAAGLALFVAAFGALGHHLPGMMRAYGDRALFERFKVRFIVSPIFLLVVCIYFTVENLHALTVVVLLWGVWHGALQVYGFFRIYDSKVKSFGKWTTNLDWLLTLGWFGAGLLYSPGRMTSLIEVFYQAGGPILHAASYLWFKKLWLAATIALSVVFVFHFVNDWRNGRPVTPLKPLSMAMSYGFWWYTTVIVPNAILGVALFEIFHDIQYLSIVWLFNRNRADTGRNPGRLTSYLFRRSGLMIALYVGLCFGYGAIRLIPEVIDVELWSRIILGVVAASTLLHFYYDGFIWKVREPEIRKGLGIEEGGKSDASGPMLAPWMAHALKWSAFVVPLVVLGYTQFRGIEPSLQQYRSMAVLVPNSPYVHNNLGVRLKGDGELEEATRHYETAIELDPSYARAHSNLGVALLQTGDVEGARAALERAVALEPDYAEARTNLASVLAASGETEASIREYRSALELSSELMEAHNGLGQALMRERDFEEASIHFRRAIELDSESPDIYTSLGLALVMSGRRGEALEAFDAALGLDANGLVALESASWILATQPGATETDAKRGVELGERAAELTEYLNASVLDSLGAAYASAGRFDRALVAARTASAIASDTGNQKLVRDIEARITLYERGEPFRETPR